MGVVGAVVVGAGVVGENVGAPAATGDMVGETEGANVGASVHSVLVQKYWPTPNPNVSAGAIDVHENKRQCHRSSISAPNASPFRP